MKSSDDQSWARYGEAYLRFPSIPLILAVARTVSPSDSRTLALAGLRGPFAVLTPENPLGSIQDNARNAELYRKAAAALTAEGLTWIEANGGSEDGNHEERGFAVTVDQTTARRLALDWQQSAYFWLDAAGVFWLVGAHVEGPPIRLAHG